MNNRFLLLLILMVSYQFSFSQKKEDSLVVRNDSIVPLKGVDTTTTTKVPEKKKHSPRKAALRSAILPGWGQAYNKKYWKIPIVYGALGTTAAVFNYNLKQYKDIQFAYRTLVNKDTANWPNVEPSLQPFIKYNAQTQLFNARSEVRQNIDYSVLIFLAFWGLNVVDAVVDAHLKGFDVTPDLSLRLKPGFSPISNTAGISLVFDLHKSKHKLVPLPTAAF